MGIVCQLGLGLRAHSLWRATAAARSAAAHGDFEAAADCVHTISQIEDRANNHPTLRRACASARASLAQALQRTPTTSQGAAS